METCITLLPETGESRDATLHELLYISQSRAQTGVTVHEQTAMAASKPVLGLAATVLLLVVLMLARPQHGLSLRRTAPRHLSDSQRALPTPFLVPMARRVTNAALL
ncbi:unnamed protein product [Musa acuminata subsp. malaccensis]|uniref:(wild Malaysian banana) hypothetical protein n=1 Tax=Musa acuminata subsp. malaccensis TaxID=214687 RepID=A0A8D7F331_MUSAM|nr:unnamed protein product [Musa acuminata subsp. malaccensis]CAG1839276.1 unnamed protein product [Musa acuminata subsp. malaccensis]